MALWTPDLISPHTWIDFSDTSTLFDATTGGSVVTNGVGIARAEDKSGNGRNFTQATSGARFTYTDSVKNGLGSAVGDGTKYLTSILSSSAWTFLHSSQSTVFVVAKNGTSSNPQAIYSWIGSNAGTSANTGILFTYDDRNVITGLTDAFNCLCSASFFQAAYASSNNSGAGIVTEFRDVITPNVHGVYTMRSDPTNATLANRIKFAANGGSLVGNNERNQGVTTNAPTFTLQIGASGNNGLVFSGDYCELIIFNSLLSTQNEQLVEGYLAWKWGLQSSLPNDHPYKNAAPTIGRARRLINDGLFNRGLFNAGLLR